VNEKIPIADCVYIGAMNPSTGAWIPFFEVFVE
jgi:hypothetical protein